MGIRIAVCALASVALLGGVAAPAAAQNLTRTDLSVGYQYTRLSGTDGSDGTNVPGGWTASVTTHINPYFNVVGEANGAYKDQGNLHNFLGGVRVGGSSPGRTKEATVFGQFLTGVGHTSNDNAESNNSFLMQPGVGLDIRGTSRMSTRVNVDYLIGRSNGDTNTGFRAAAGVVFDLKR